MLTMRTILHWMVVATTAGSHCARGSALFDAALRDPHVLPGGPQRFLEVLLLAGCDDILIGGGSSSGSSSDGDGGRRGGGSGSAG